MLKRLLSSALAYASRSSRLHCSLFMAASTTLITHSIQADMTVNAADVGITKLQIKAGQFLAQATMGHLPYQMTQLADRMAEIGEEAALNEWIDNEFSKPHQSILALADSTIAGDGFDGEESSTTNPNLQGSITSYQQSIWWDRAIRGNDQLRQRVAWGLIQIFVTSGNVDQGRLAARWRQPLSYYDVLLSNAFGNYLDLLKEVTYHPFMGIYLSHLKNAKGDEAAGIFADENYAREVLQLFSMGIYKLNQNGDYVTDSNGLPIENYTNDHIREFAKVFTGLTYASSTGDIPTNYYGAGRNYNYPMVMDNNYHDMTEKKLFGTRTIAAGTNGDHDISQALTHISNQSSVPPYMCRQLIQRLTSSNPSSAYIGRVTAAWRTGGTTKGDFQAVIRAILMDPEARDSLDFTETTLSDGKVLIEVDPKDDLHGRTREPVLMLTHFLKRYLMQSSEPNGTLKPVSLSGTTQQRVLRAPSVFNYYSAEYQPGNGPLADVIDATGEQLVLPESELLPTSCIPMFEGLLNYIRAGEINQNITASSVPAVLNRLITDKSVERPTAWIIENMNRFMCYGTMPDSLKSEIGAIMDNDSIGNYNERFARSLAILMSSADYAIVY